MFDWKERKSVQILFLTAPHSNWVTTAKLLWTRNYIHLMRFINLKLREKKQNLDLAENICLGKANWWYGEINVSNRTDMSGNLTAHLYIEILSVVFRTESICGYFYEQIIILDFVLWQACMKCRH